MFKYVFIHARVTFPQHSNNVMHAVTFNMLQVAWFHDFSTCETGLDRIH